MRREILTLKQKELLPLIKSFSADFGLVGGTAFALILGYRRSIDFDLFTNKEFDNFKIKRKISRFKRIMKVIDDEKGQFTLMLNEIKITFFHYPFKLNFSKKFEDIIKLPDLLTLAAMKAYALGRRAKWKDYVDLYFVMKEYFPISKIIEKAKKIFKSEFNEKLFRSQLAYFKDIDYSEEIIYLPGFRVDDKIIKKKLIEFSL